MGKRNTLLAFKNSVTLPYIKQQIFVELTLKEYSDRFLKLNRLIKCLRCLMFQAKIIRIDAAHSVISKSEICILLMYNYNSRGIYCALCYFTSPTPLRSQRTKTLRIFRVKNLKRFVFKALKPVFYAP